MKSMNLAILALASFGFLASAAQADGFGRWRRHDGEFSRQGFEMPIGLIRLGDENQRIDAEVIDIRNNRGVECNLTHIKMSALNKGVRIKRVIVEYRNGQRDAMDLNDNNAGPAGPGWGRPDPRRMGITLMPGSSSEWLNVDDVMDGMPDGRCVDRIMIMGRDIDFDRFDGRPGPGGPGWGRPGFDQGAMVSVTGFVKPRRPDFNGPGGPGWGRPGPGGPGWGRPGPGPGGPGWNNPGPGRPGGMNPPPPPPAPVPGPVNPGPVNPNPGRPGNGGNGGWNGPRR